METARYAFSQLSVFRLMNDCSTTLLSVFDYVSVRLQQHPDVLAAVEYSRLFDLFKSLLCSSEQAAAFHVWTSQFKWLRGVPRGQCTGFHLDRVYMRASSPLYSVWMPLGDLQLEHGNLIVAPESHRSDQFARLRSEYGRSDVGARGDGARSGWIRVEEYTKQPVRWVSSPMKAGSVVLLDLSVLHCTSINQSDEYRLSCDTRWTITEGSAVDAAAAESSSSVSNSHPHPPQATIKFKLQSRDKSAES
jgi:ectoine hydroxylase-related dioxygenase (phytanoyl-CoA dioxygenase family)